MIRNEAYSYEAYMDKQSQLTILLSGALGLMLAVLTARPKKMTDSLISILGGLFGAVIVAPAVAEALTSLSGKIGHLSWLNAAPQTALFAAIIGLGGLLGGQIVIALRSDFVAFVRQYAKKWFKIKDGNENV